MNCIINKIYFILFDADFRKVPCDDYIFEQAIFFMALPKAKGKSNTKFKKT